MNSERYLVANGFLVAKANTAEENAEATNSTEESSSPTKLREVAISLLEKLHVGGFSDQESVAAIFPPDWLKKGIRPRPEIFSDAL